MANDQQTSGQGNPTQTVPSYPSMGEDQRREAARKSGEASGKTGGRPSAATPTATRRASSMAKHGNPATGTAQAGGMGDEPDHDGPDLHRSGPSAVGDAGQTTTARPGSYQGNNGSDR